MKKKLLIGIINPLIIATGILFLPTITLAAKGDLEVDGFEIMPKLESKDIEEINEKIQEIGSVGGHVWETYNKSADSLTTAQQVNSGIMNRNTLLNYLVFISKFLSQLGLFVGAGFIIFAGYKYMLSVFNGGKTPASTLKNAIIGVIIVIFSYAIMKVFTSIIGLT